METKISKAVIRAGGILEPGKFLHHTLRLRGSAPLEVSVINRHDIEAEAVLDKEGWCVIILTNVVGVPVKISEEEPLRLVITPQTREAS